MIFSILVSGMAYTSDIFFPSSDAVQSLYLNNIKNCKVFHQPVPILHMTMKAFSPLLFLFLTTLGKWLTKTFSFCHIRTKFKYLFLNSRKHLCKQHMCFIVQKVLLFLLVAFTFEAKVPSKAQLDMNNVVNKDHQHFTNQYFAVADIIRPNSIKEQFSLHALSKLKFSKHY